MKIALVMLSEDKYEEFYPVRAFTSKDAAEVFIVACKANSTSVQLYKNTWHITDLEYVDE